MTDLKKPKWMYLKAVAFILIGAMTFALLLTPQGLWIRMALQLLMIWAFARAYYFAFYVIEHYVDNTYKFSGLLHFGWYAIGEIKKVRRAKEMWKGR
jgi:hypothetical protein